MHTWYFHGCWSVQISLIGLQHAQSECVLDFIILGLCIDCKGSENESWPINTERRYQCYQLTSFLSSMGRPIIGLVLREWSYPLQPCWFKIQTIVQQVQWETIQRSISIQKMKDLHKQSVEMAWNCAIISLLDDKYIVNWTLYDHKHGQRFKILHELQTELATLQYCSKIMVITTASCVTCLFALANAYHVSDLAALCNWTDNSRILETSALLKNGRNHHVMYNPLLHHSYFIQNKK